MKEQLVTKVTSESIPIFSLSKKLQDKQLYKSDVLYSDYRRNIGFGLGFIIPGLVFAVMPLIIGTWPVANYFAIMSSPDFSWDYNSLGLLAPASIYFSCIFVGLVAVGVSIPFFLKAEKSYKAVLKKYELAIDVGSRNDGVAIAMNVSF